MQLTRYLKQYAHEAILLCWIVVFVSIKLPHLELPYFWDESYPYSFAITHLVKNGVSLFPGAVPPDLSTGHPLLFYFLESLWVSLLGDSVFTRHLLPLLFSIATMCVLFYYCKRVFSKDVGLYAVLILSSHSVFIAQSSFVLPETLVTLLSALSVFSFLCRQRIVFVIAVSLLLLTKEPSIFIIAALGAFCLLKLIRKDNGYGLRPFLADVGFILLPTLVFSAYFLVQKLTYGWFFYPRHVGYVDLSLISYFKKLSAYFSVIFLHTGRNVVSVLILACIASAVFFRRSIRVHGDKILLFVLIIAVFLFGSAANFRSPRYILCLLPLVAVIFGLLIELASINRNLSRLIAVTIVGVQLWFAFTEKRGSDISLGYVDVVQIHQETVELLERSAMYDSVIYAEFLMMHNLTSTSPAYLSSDRVFRSVSIGISEHTDVFVCNSLENNDRMDAIRADGQFALVKRFEKGKFWSEVYVRANR